MYKAHLIRSILPAVCAAGTAIAAETACSETAYHTALINVEARDATDLSGPWRYIVDPMKIGISRADSRCKLAPGTGIRRDSRRVDRTREPRES